MYRANNISIRKEGDDWVIVDISNDHQENAILATLGHPETDYPERYLFQFAEQLVKVINGREELITSLEEMQKLQRHATYTGFQQLTKDLKEWRL